MSDFIDMLVEMLPANSELQKKDNELRGVLDLTVGEYMDSRGDVSDELFLDSATGGWLDAHGRDYGVKRKSNEDDDSYRKRIIFEKLEYLTVENLKEIFGLTLYVAVDGFNPRMNQLTSDNTYLRDAYMAIDDETVQSILDNKFILDNNIIWLNKDGWLND